MTEESQKKCSFSDVPESDDSVMLGFKKKDARFEIEPISRYRKITISENSCFPVVQKNCGSFVRQNHCDFAVSKKEYELLTKDLKEAEARDERDYSFAMEYKDKIEQLEQLLAEKEKSLKEAQNYGVFLVEKNKEKDKQIKLKDLEIETGNNIILGQRRKIKELKDDLVSNSRNFWKEQAIEKDKQIEKWQAGCCERMKIIAERDKQIKELKDDLVSNSRDFWKKQAIEKDKQIKTMQRTIDKLFEKSDKYADYLGNALKETEHKKAKE